MCGQRNIRGEMEGRLRRMAANSEGIEKAKKSQEEFQEGSKNCEQWVKAGEATLCPHGSGASLLHDH